MFGELPKLFDRNFTIGYVLPSALFLGAILLLLQAFEFDDILTVLTTNDPLLDTAYIIISVWFVGIVLLSLNYIIVRFLEGYGKRNPLKYLLSRSKRAQFDEIAKRLKVLDQKHGEKKITDQETVERRELKLELAERFPNNRSSVLPTSFGNALRAFEKYPKVVYGLEATRGWDRLQAVVSKQYLGLLDNAKAQTDMWVNVWFLSMIYVGVYLALTIQFEPRFPIPRVLVAAIVIGYFACRQTTTAAVLWGRMVKSAFDVYLPTLASKMGYTLPLSREAEWKLWDDFSQSMLYRQKKYLPLRTAQPKFTEEEAED